jgi:hypothetical protein
METLAQSELRMLYGLRQAMEERVARSVAEPGRYAVVDGMVVDTEAAELDGPPPEAA